MKSFCIFDNIFTYDALFLLGSFRNKAFNKRNQNAKIAGFRPGKAPKDVFIKHYGVESLYFDAADDCLNTAYVKMLQDIFLRVIIVVVV